MGKLKDKSIKFAKKKAYENKWEILSFLIKHKWARKKAFEITKNVSRKKIKKFFD